jgi:hypothetical protein
MSGMMVTKHALDFIVNWFVLAKADISQYVGLFLLAYVMTNVSKPEAIWDLKTHLPNPLAKLKININTFHINNKASSKEMSSRCTPRYTLVPMPLAKISPGSWKISRGFSQVLQFMFQLCRNLSQLMYLH